MRFDVLTLFPEFAESIVSYGVLGRACKRGLLDIKAWNPRDYTLDRHRTVDDRPYGGGPGMVMMIDPLRRALATIREQCGAVTPVIYLSPQGARLTQQRVRELALTPGAILLCGRYEGVDERLIEHEVDEEISVGDYVLSGGEPAAGVLIDAVARLLPGVLGDSESAEQDSFSEGWLDCGHWTRPEQDAYGSVPQVLMSGDHARIARWRRQQGLGRTWLKRPDLLTDCELSVPDKRLLDEFKAQHEAATGDEDL